MIEKKDLKEGVCFLMPFNNTDWDCRYITDFGNVKVYTDRLPAFKIVKLVDCNLVQVQSSDNDCLRDVSIEKICDYGTLIHEASFERIMAVPVYDNPTRREDLGSEKNGEWQKTVETYLNHASLESDTLPKDVLRFRKITKEMADTFEKKNHDYGNSFRKLFEEYGMTYPLCHLEEKLARVKTLMEKDAKVSGEGILDSLYDLANYAVMTIMELKRKEEENGRA